MNKKRCQKCKGTKNINLNSIKSNGQPSYLCRTCNTIRARKYRKTKDGMERVRKAVYKSTKKHREKQNARTTLAYHVQKGNVVKPNICEKCGVRKYRNNIQGHHTDYSKPLEVLWLCWGCHADMHKA